MTHIDCTLESIETKIASLTMRISDISKAIQLKLKTDSGFFASDEHAALFNSRCECQKQRDELHDAYMIIIKHF